MTRSGRMVVACGLGLLLLTGSGRGWSGGQVETGRGRLFEPADLRADLQTLWAVLDEGHGGFERYTARDTLRKLFDQAEGQLTRPMSDLEFYRLLLPLVAAIKDGHTSINLSDAARTALASRPVFFPFELRFIDKRTYLFRNLSASREVPDGSELLEINGRAMGTILEQVLTVVPCDAGILSRRLRLLERAPQFGQYLALLFGQTESFRLRIRARGEAAPREVTVAGVPRSELDGVRLVRYPGANPARPLHELTYRGSTAVLTIRGFVDDRAAGAVPYRDFLQRAFNEIDARKVPALVIDVRGNGGGQDEYGRLLFAHFMDAPFQYYRALEVKKDRFDLFKYVASGRPDWPGDGVRKNARGWYDVTAHPNVGTMRPETPRFWGKTCILIDGLSFSTTGESTSLFHHHKKATFVGEECGAGYYGNTSGAMPLVVLPRTLIQLRIPLVLYTLAVDGYPKDRGIVPDIAVTPTIEDLLAGRDVVMDRALAFLTTGVR